MTQMLLKKQIRENSFRLSDNRQTCRSFLKQFSFVMSMFLILMHTGACLHKLERVKTDQEPYSKIIRTSYAATDIIAEIMKQRDFDTNGAIIGASLVNINNLAETCSLGRIVSEQMMGRLAQHGFKIVEMKIRQDSIFIKKNEGEFLLSRELQNIGDNHQANAALVGTYAVSKYVVFISVRMIRTSDNSVIASYDYQLPLDFITKSLI